MSRPQFRGRRGDPAASRPLAIHALLSRVPPDKEHTSFTAPEWVSDALSGMEEFGRTHGLHAELLALHRRLLDDVETTGQPGPLLAAAHVVSALLRAQEDPAVYKYDCDVRDSSVRAVREVLQALRDWTVPMDALNPAVPMALARAWVDQVGHEVSAHRQAGARRRASDDAHARRALVPAAFKEKQP